MKKKLYKYSGISLFSKIILVIIVIGMLVSHINLVSIVKAIEVKEEVTVDEEVNRDFSKLRRIDEIDSLRTENSKTYLKENGMYETEYYNERIHFKNNGKWEEINNSLKLRNERYYNSNNIYNISLPKTIDKDSEIEIKYLNKSIKLYLETENSASGKLNETINRNIVNLKDEIKYQINKNETIEYSINQTSVKENIILNSYVKNYQYSYYIVTCLRIERIGNNLYFYDGKEEIFVMNEYLMYDMNNNISKDIDYTITRVSNNKYKINVVPSDEYLKNANYPVVIDPEFSISDGGYLDGVFSVTVNDLQEETSTFLDTGSFTINNRNNLDTTDDIKAIFNVTIPNEYTIGNVYDAIGKNQFMYAYIELPTLSTSATTNTTVILKEINNSVTTEVTRVNFHNANVFNQTFNVYDIIKTKLDELETSDINFSFELTLEGQNNTTISYSLGGDLIGEKPKLKIGYLSDAGLASYYTYEALPIGDLSNIYIAHNSGNLTYVFNDYTDNNLLNFSHIYNDNRKHKDSVYGNGYSINYNEYITTFSTDNKLLLTEGDGREIIYYSTNSTNTEYLASDGSGNILRKILSSSVVTGYEIETVSNELKTYDSSGKLIKIYSDVKKRVNGVWNNDAEFVSLTYTNNKLTKISDSYGNYINLIYSSNYLSEIKVYKYSPTLSSTSLVSKTLYEYVDGNLTEIDRFIGNTLTNEVRVTYDTKKHSTQILDNSIGYKLTYDNQNRIKKAKVYSSSISNGDYVDFIFSPNGKKTVVANGLSEVTSYTFDDYYHTSSVESSTGYTTFYKYEDIYYDSSGNSIASPNYNLNHKIKVQSNSFKNTYNLISNHGFEIVTSSGIYGWEKSLTSSSTATIDATSILYGSRVLKLYKASSGVAKVYQDIEVEANTEYIITGYIKNTNTVGGAYITVESQEIDGEVTVLSSSSMVKSTNDFVRYEYKFKTDFNGRVRVILENTSTGYAYFDNIQINTTYLDTRYNYIINSSFEDDGLSGWNGYNYLVEERNNVYFNENCG